ncbi:hypothetical protein [Halocatena marina]|uniref:hypothetical protein n=1 Tax=Halocatena marina TaxID=2934937 RepID=UPI00200D34E1|nr:hypothetical protein [Halocatena marina]
MSADNPGSATKFNLFEGSGGRLFLYIHTGTTAITLELDREDSDRDRLLKRLGEPPTPIRGD